MVTQSQKLVLIVMDVAISKFSDIADDVRAYVMSDNFLNQYPKHNIAYIEHYQGTLKAEQYIINGKHRVLQASSNNNIKKSERLLYAFQQISENSSIKIDKILYFGAQHGAYQYCKLSHELPVTHKFIYLGDRVDDHVIHISIHDKPGYILHGGKYQEENYGDSRLLLRSIFFIGDVISMNHQDNMNLLINSNLVA
jgi:hypothetical protein